MLGCGCCGCFEVGLRWELIDFYKVWCYDLRAMCGMVTVTVTVTVMVMVIVVSSGESGLT